MFLLTINNNSFKKEVTHLCTKMVILNDNIENNLTNISNLCSHVNIDRLFIFSIVISDTFEYEVTEIDSPSHIKYIEIGSTFFINNILESSDPEIDFWDYNKHSLFIIRDGDYAYIKEMFVNVQGLNVNVVRGSSQKKSYGKSY